MTVINDGGGVSGRNGKTTGYVADANVKLGKDTDLLLEYALTEGEGGTRVGNFGLLGNEPGAGDSQGSAKLAELTHRGDNLYLRAFYREAENNFGLGTTSGLDSAMKRYGFEAIYNFKTNKGQDIIEGEESWTTLFKEGLSLYARATKNRDTAGRGSVSVSEIGMRKDGDSFSFFSGIRHVRENVRFSYELGDGQRSFASDSTLSQIVSGGEIEVIKDRLTIFGAHEQPFSDSQGTPSLYGNKSYIGFDTKPFRYTAVTGTHEWIDLNGEEYQNSGLSLNVSPTDGMTLAVGLRNHVLPEDELTAATSSIRQQIPLGDGWGLNLGYLHHETIGGAEGIYSQIHDIPDYYLPFFLRDGSVRSPMNFSTTGYWESYDLVGIGITKSGDGWSWMNAAEYRNSETEDRYNFSTSLIGNVTESFTAGLQGSYQFSSLKGLTIEAFKQDLAERAHNLGADISQFTDDNTLDFLKDSHVAQITGGTAYRPYQEDGPVFLHRTLLEMRENQSDDSFFKFVNNFAMQADLTDKLELNAQYAVKYVSDRYNGVRSDELINIVGTEWRYDIAGNWDAGLQGAISHAAGTKVTEYSYGASVGYVPTRNVLLRAGYNVAGFKDRDFSAFNYTAQGPYFKINVKFDQEDVRDKLRSFMGGGTSP